MPVLNLRLRDAMRRSRRYGHQSGLLLVELLNHAGIVARHGGEVDDRALVVAASRLSHVARDMDTVCRVANARFAILVEGPLLPDDLMLLAQHIVAKGLEQVPFLPAGLSLRFRLASMALTDEETAVDDGRVLEGLGAALDQMADHPPQGGAAFACASTGTHTVLSVCLEPVVCRLHPSLFPNPVPGEDLP